jgi:L-seryl-tRNA(Ser) seleniumtransferase
MPQELLRHLPQVEKLLSLPRIRAAAGESPRSLVTGAVRSLLAGLREEVIEERLSEPELLARLSEEEIGRRFEEELARLRRSAYERVINATGIILHTGLGRAVLSRAALEALYRNLAGYSLVEIDPETGERNHREGHLTALLRDLTGAEAATVVNNNAAATLLILAALARGKEVIISRGQLVEIGGSFRIPDILEESGARLVEVGTTNRTYAADYRRAITPQTGLLLQVHTSNYAIKGFAHHTPLEEIVEVGRENGIPVASDLGSGCFVDLSRHGFEPEPLVAEVVKAGADLVSFSGDKLLGGPQAGIIVGARDRVEELRAHPLFRALRVDKATLVGLEATLRAYRDPGRIAEAIPALGLILEPVEAVRARAEAALAGVRKRAPRIRAEVVSSRAQAGSGALPAQEIPSWAVAIAHPDLGADELARRLRLAAPRVFARIQADRVLLDFRTVLAGEEDDLAAALAALG